MNELQLVDDLGYELVRLQKIANAVERNEITATRAKHETARVGFIAQSLIHSENKYLSAYGALLNELRHRIIALARSETDVQRKAAEKAVHDTLRKFSLLELLMQEVGTGGIRSSS
jgi:hypothetical protein